MSRHINRPRNLVPFCAFSEYSTSAALKAIKDFGLSMATSVFAVILLGVVNSAVAAQAITPSTEAINYYRNYVAQPVIAARCIACHLTGGVAPNSGASLIFARNNDDANISAISDYIEVMGDAGGTLLGKTKGVSHGGGVVFGAESSAYLALAEFVELLLAPAQDDEDQTGGTNGDNEADDASFYASEVDPVITRHCVVCHGPGLTAEQAGAQLIFGPTQLARQQSLDTYVTQYGDSGDWLLAKVLGDADHGGGQVLSEGTAEFLALRDYLAQLGVTALEAADQGEPSFWDGTQLESRPRTLRRASILLSGRVPDNSALERAHDSDAALKEELIALMHGVGFKQFLTTGANDRLLVSGLLSGIDFPFELATRYPLAAELLVEFPERTPEKFEGYYDKPFLTRGDAEFAMRWGLVRAPLELIAHVVMEDLPYTEILTAEYTMVNKFTEVAYRNEELQFPAPFTDEQGFWDRASANEFAPGTDRGQVPMDENYWFDWEAGVFGQFTDYVDRPHAGILSMPAWLSRYPSTDTNRNRARARWTYYHFLGIDIEASAPRSTDPDALTDTNNPTLNNSACTVCHERLDQVAGAYQLFGDSGTLKDQHGGLDSLSEYYKYPQRFGGSAGDSPYRHGDTWYRDMLRPGLESQRPRNFEDSLQWLGKKVAEDPRFAAATVRFWWPAIFGAEALRPPEDPEQPHYQAALRAFAEQDATIKKLAVGFVESGYQLKSLLADMILSPWYRTNAVTGSLSSERAAELANVGSGRLLTPEELDRKNRAVLGRSWGEREENNAHDFFKSSYLTSLNSHESVKTLYGGIDGASMLQRNRAMTPLKSNVAQRMALEMACQVVLTEFEKPATERVVFSQVEKTDADGLIAAEQFALGGKTGSTSDWISHKLNTSITHPGGRLSLRLADMTPNSYARHNEDAPSNADLIFKSVTIHKDGRLQQRILGVDLLANDDFGADTYTDDSGDVHWRGDVRRDVPGFWLHENAWVSFSVDLPKGDYRFEWSLATSLHHNAYPEAIDAHIMAYAIDKPEQALGSLRIKKQIHDLWLRATNQPASEAQVNTMYGLVSEYASARRALSSNYFDENSNCDLWMAGWGELSHEEWARRTADPTGMLRGWTLALESILSSYSYLHD